MSRAHADEVQFKLHQGRDRVVRGQDPGRSGWAMADYFAGMYRVYSETYADVYRLAYMTNYDDAAMAHRITRRTLDVVLAVGNAVYSEEYRAGVREAAAEVLGYVDRMTPGEEAKR